MPEFDLEDLRDRAFVGFVRFGNLSREDSLIPADSGVYVLVADAIQPEFLPRSPAGWWKGRDPTVPIDRLATEWVDGVPTVYIGKADSLRSRLDLLTGFARGEAIMHWGGRLLWQLASSNELLVAWRLARDFGDLECDLIDEFRDVYGRLPYANLRRGSRSRASRAPD